jgi:hypothetical protein
MSGLRMRGVMPPLHNVLIAWCLVKHRDNFTFILSHMLYWGAGIAQRYSAWIRAGWSRVRVPVGARNFSPYHRVQTGSGATQPTIQWAPGFPFLGVKRREADQTPSSTEVNNAWNYTSTPPIRLHDVLSYEKAQGQLYHMHYCHRCEIECDYFRA